MSQSHDPIRQISYLDQCLSNDKRPLAFFFGAGCPASIKCDTDIPLIPDIAGMTAEVRKRLNALDDVSGFLEIIEEHLSEDECLNINIETILSHIRGLRFVAGNGEVRGLTANNLEQLDESICSTVSALAEKALPSTSTPYHATAMWVDAIQREYPVEFFTTNYDLLLEQALEYKRVAYFDGFTGSHQAFFDLRAMEEDRLPPRWARVWKLHGSLNWYFDSRRGVLRGSRKESQQQRVIHPSHLKYEESRRMPYLAMVDRFRTFFRQESSVLVVLGYSFRDEHLNEVMVQGLRGTQSAVVFALLYDKLSNYPNAVSIAQQRPNLSLLARDGGVIGGSRANWINIDSISTNCMGVPWISQFCSEKPKKSNFSTNFNLGDFSLFGSFLESLVRDATRFQDVNDAS